MNSNHQNNQVTGLASLPFRKAKLKVAPLELPFVKRAKYIVKFSTK